MASDYVVGLYEGLVLAETVTAPRGALKFTNTSGQLRLGTGPSSGSSFSFCSWVKITTDTNNYALWLSLQGASTTYWEAGFDITGTGSILADASVERAVGINFTVGTWYFFGVSQSSGACKVMIGTEGGNLTKFTSTLANLTLPLSEKLYGGELSLEALAGAMSEARFWNAALTDAEFLTEYYSAVQARTSNAGGYHKLENTTSKLTDSSAAANTLTAPTGTGTWVFEPGPNILPAPSGSPFENIGMAETIDVVYTPSGGSSYTGSVSETVTLSEALGAVDAAIVGVAETDTFSESLASAFVGASNLTETDTLSESTAAVYSGVIGPAETVTLSESAATQSNEASGLAETVTLSEALAGGSQYTGGVSDSVSVSDAVGALSGAVVAVAETDTLSESAASTYNAIVTPAETVTNSESLTGIQNGGGSSYTGSVSETVTVSEAAAALFAASVATSESLFVTLPPMPELGTTDLHLVAEDWAPGSNWASRVGGFTAALNGSLSKQEESGIERAGILGFGTSNYFSLAANAAHEFTTSSRFTYEFVIKAGAAGGNLLGRYATPYGGGYDLSAFAAGITAGVYGDGGAFYYAVTTGASALTAGAYYLVTIVLDGPGDAFTTYVNGVQDSTDPSTGFAGVTNTSAVAFFLGNSNGNNQGFDGSIVEVLRHRTALNSTTIRDRYALNVVAASRGTAGAPSETVTTSDAASSAFAGLASIAEAVSVTEATSLSQVLANGLTETVTLSEQASALASLARVVAETVSFAESLASSITNSALVAETVNLSEVIALTQVLANLLTETVTLAEAMIGYIPRVLVIEPGDPTAVIGAVIVSAPRLAVETDDPKPVVTVTTSLQGLP